MQKPFSQACENNKAPILSVLEQAFAEVKSVLEIGSGTGQHAVWFARYLPHLRWQPSDQEVNLAGMHLRFDEESLANLLPPVVLDVTQPHWPVRQTDAIFTANTLHIMAWDAVQALFARVPEVLVPGGKLCVYGPFNYKGAYTSESNARFDQWLAEQSPVSAIRDFDQVNRLAEEAGLSLIADHAMPANNRLLEWQANL